MTRHTNGDILSRVWSWFKTPSCPAACRYGSRLQLNSLSLTIKQDVKRTGLAHDQKTKADQYKGHHPMAVLSDGSPDRPMMYQPMGNRAPNSGHNCECGDDYHRLGGGVDRKKRCVYYDIVAAVCYRHPGDG